MLLTKEMMSVLQSTDGDQIKWELDKDVTENAMPELQVKQLLELDFNKKKFIVHKIRKKMITWSKGMLVILQRRVHSVINKRA
jgi:hypothetical protein